SGVPARASASCLVTRAQGSTSGAPGFSVAPADVGDSSPPASAVTPWSPPVVVAGLSALPQPASATTPTSARPASGARPGSARRRARPVHLLVIRSEERRVGTG